MSLLMQALKKAERAKQNSDQESELDKPSEAFDDLLGLSSAPDTAKPIDAASGIAFDLEPMAGLSLSPLDPEPIRAAPPSGPVDPSPAIAGLAPLELSNETRPTASMVSEATEAIHDPVPPQARLQDAIRAASAATPPPPAAAARSAGEPKADPAASAPSRAAARARAAATSSSATVESESDPAKRRIAILTGIVVVIIAGYGYYFWQATSGPGAGSRLPMVPMPPPSATGSTPAMVVVAQGDAAAGNPAGTSNNAALDPLAGSAARPPDEKARREQQLEREQMYNQLYSALQSQLAQQRPAAPPDALPAAVAPDSSDIRVARSSSTPAVDPTLVGGYQAFGKGDLNTAQLQYDAALKQDPNNRDALLGVAAISLRQQQEDRAIAAYTRLLDLDPSDADALAGLTSLRRGDSSQNEQRLQNVLKQKPDSGPLLFALGNLYARQGRWPEAQQTYFRAYTAAPTNADYAFNLAIGLDRLNQPKLALNYYRRALVLSQDQSATFDRTALRKRMQELGGSIQP